MEESCGIGFFQAWALSADHRASARNCPSSLAGGAPVKNFTGFPGAMKAT
jgi:hypothetical protein